MDMGGEGEAHRQGDGGLKKDRYEPMGAGKERRARGLASRYQSTHSDRQVGGAVKRRYRRATSPPSTKADAVGDFGGK